MTNSYYDITSHIPSVWSNRQTRIIKNKKATQPQSIGTDTDTDTDTLLKKENFHN